ncbi:MAG TPA: DUF1326 domain-containing protein, partial [Candidatus Brocadiaceae bacterium]|nr:DUF1326 domain-containing protein [Candidatus Brocadiaceae bacterium]
IIMFFSVSGAAFSGPAWFVEGEYFEGCTCNPGCPCMFGSEPTHNKTCKISGVFHIQKGAYGQYTLDMGKAVAHRFAEGNQAWNYDGRSGFATKFSFTGN